MKIKLFAFCLVTIFYLASSCYARNPSVQLNGEVIDFKDDNGNIVNPQIINDRTMVPLRKIFELLGCEIEWNGSTKTVIATKGEKEIELQIGNSVAKLNKNEEIKLDSPPVIVDNRTLVPLRFISESLGMEVAWDNENSVAIIIDYSFLESLLKEKAPSVYERMIERDRAVEITKEYIDEVFSNRNETTILKIDSKGGDNYSISFDGNSTLIKEIKNEEWDKIDFSLKQNKEGIFVKTNNYVFSNMLDGKKNEDILLDEVRFNFSGTENDEIGTSLSRLIKIKNNEITKDTFSKIKSDFSRLFDTFLKVGERELKEDNFIYETIDIGRLANIFTLDKNFNILVLANRSMFNYNLIVSDFFADYPKPKYAVSVSKNNTIIKITLRNDYKERIMYNIVL